MIRKITRKTYIITLLLGIIVVQLFLLIYPNSTSVNYSSDLELKEYAQEVVDICKNEAYRPSCYDREVPKLMNMISMEEAFEVTKLVQSLDPEYAYCHVLGHELSALEVRKDPSKWKDVLARCPSGVCSNGCLHGGLQEKFRGEYLTEEQIEDVRSDLATICESRDGFSPTGMEQNSCYHALGHLTMYITNADINRSLKLCDESALKSDGRDLRTLCYDGVFMQLFQPLEPEDFALIKGKEQTIETVDAFCNSYANSQKVSCQIESWPLFRDSLMNDPMGSITFCSKVEDTHRNRCYNGIFYILTSQLNLDSTKIEKYCSNVISEQRPNCFAYAASRMIETDYRNINKAIDLCKTAENYDAGERCYQEMLSVSGFNFHPDSKEYHEICSLLPGNWGEQCLKNAGIN